jgi:hypothetical protein
MIPCFYEFVKCRGLVGSIGLPKPTVFIPRQRLVEITGLAPALILMELSINGQGGEN